MATSSETRAPWWAWSSIGLGAFLLFGAMTVSIAAFSSEKDREAEDVKDVAASPAQAEGAPEELAFVEGPRISSSSRLATLPGVTTIGGARAGITSFGSTFFLSPYRLVAATSVNPSSIYMTPGDSVGSPNEWANLDALLTRPGGILTPVEVSDMEVTPNGEELWVIDGRANYLAALPLDDPHNPSVPNGAAISQIAIPTDICGASTARSTALAIEGDTFFIGGTCAAEPSATRVWVQSYENNAWTIVQEPTRVDASAKQAAIVADLVVSASEIELHVGVIAETGPVDDDLTVVTLDR